MIEKAFNGMGALLWASGRYASFSPLVVRDVTPWRNVMTAALGLHSCSDSHLVLPMDM